MGSCRSCELIVSFFVFGLCYVASQDYYEQRHIQHFKTQSMGHLKEIPKRFELYGNKAKYDFPRYIHDIQDLANGENLTVVYKVKVETIKPKSVYTKKNILKSKPKKYNIPLKKKNMKLSNFEIIMRKLADTSGPKAFYQDKATTEDQARTKLVITTKIPVLKYKPILNQVKTKYAKGRVIRPIRNKVITLTV